MKLCIPVTTDHQINEHFGHCDYYSIYSIDEAGNIINDEIIQAAEGCGCKSNIASVLAQKGVSLMLAGGIGNGAINVLHQHGIDVIRGCSGNAHDIAAQFAAGHLIDSGTSCQQHGNGHECQH